MPDGNSQVIESLQASLRLHWSAIEAYSLMAAHYAAWGFPKLAERYASDAEEERSHAKKLMARLEFFDVDPAVDHESVLWPRHDFVGALGVAYEMEVQSASLERSGYTIALAADDPVTADLFRENLVDSEDSINQIEAIRDVIDQIGADNFLANQA